MWRTGQLKVKLAPNVNGGLILEQCTAFCGDFEWLCNTELEAGGGRNGQRELRGARAGMRAAGVEGCQQGAQPPSDLIALSSRWGNCPITLFLQ